VAVGGTGVGVGGMRVAVGVASLTDVSVGGTRTAVGGMGASVGVDIDGRGVAVEGTDVTVTAELG